MKDQEHNASYSPSLSKGEDAKVCRKNELPEFGRPQIPDREDNHRQNRRCSQRDRETLLAVKDSKQ